MTNIARRGAIASQRRGSPVTVYSACDTVTDSFNRAAAGDHTLGSADTGQRWSNFTPPGFNDGYWTTQGTTVNTAQAQVPTIDHYRAMNTMLDAGGNNQDVTLDGKSDHDNTLGVWVRLSADGLNGYHVVYSNYAPGVYKFVAGSGTPIASFPAISLNTAFTARVRIKDNNLQAYLNGTKYVDITIDPDDAGGHPETTWTWLGLREDHGSSGGSAPTQITVYTDTHWDNLSAVAP